MESNNLFFKRITLFLKELFQNKTRSKPHTQETVDPAVLILCLKAKSRSNVAEEYGISVRTLNRWFESRNLKIPRGLICPNLLREIYTTYGPPKNTKKDK